MGRPKDKKVNEHFVAEVVILASDKYKMDSDEFKNSLMTMLKLLEESEKYYLKAIGN